MAEAPDERRKLPSVDTLLGHAGVERVIDEVPRVLVRRAVREVLAEERVLLHGPAARVSHRVPSLDVLAERATERARKLATSGVTPVVNATGVVVHTNLGRSLLSTAAIASVSRAAAHYTTLEYDLERGERGSRLDKVRRLVLEVTGADDALVVNNCAGAVLLTLAVLASGRDVIVSRGELVEIGGSFRVPDIMARSGAKLVEVGTTNKTRAADYERAITPDTALLLKAHRSNFSMDGFTAEPSLAELVAVGREHDVPVVHDLGSGALVDLADLAPVSSEPTVADSLHAGSDLVMFSGDKLLGGPQAGIIVGRSDLVERLRVDPMARALRLDKLSIAALEATLESYLDPGEVARELPTLRMLAVSQADLRVHAEELAEAVRGARPDLGVAVVETASRVGGGAHPAARVPSWAVSIDAGGGGPVSALAEALRRGDPPVLGRIEADRLLLDVRTLLAGDPERIVRAFRAQEGRADSR